MKILLFGKNGQLGWELQRSLAPLGHITALDFDSQDGCGDFCNPAGIADTVRQISPNVIINAAAHTAVDKAESESDLAHTINAVGPSVLAQEAMQSGAWLIHYSTDYVFNGSGTQAWSESDTPDPLNVYGKTKLAGEQAIRHSACRHLIFRTSWVYAARGHNFAKTILKLAQQRDDLAVIDDQIGAPTSAELLADVSAHAIRMAIQNPALTGLYHLTANGETSWHQYACHVIEFARQAGVDIKVKPDAIRAVAGSEFITAAARPKNSRLDTGKLQNAFGLTLPSWQSGINRMLTEIIEKPL